MTSTLDALLKALENLEQQMQRLRESEMPPGQRYEQMLRLMKRHRRIALRVLKLQRLARLDGSEDLFQHVSQD